MMVQIYEHTMPAARPVASKLCLDIDF